MSSSILLSTHLIVLAINLVAVRVRRVGWRWGVISVAAWLVALLIGALAAVADGDTRLIIVACAGGYYIGVLALVLGRAKLFRWIIGTYGLPATIGVLGGT